jgi:hypothetical protein
MMKFRYLLAASLAVAVSAPGFAKDDGTASAPKEKKVCKTERVTGSLVSKRRICLTQDQWDKIAADTKKNMDEYGSRMGGVRDGAGQAG